MFIIVGCSAGNVAQAQVGSPAEYNVSLVTVCVSQFLFGGPCDLWLHRLISVLSRLSTCKMLKPSDHYLLRFGLLMIVYICLGVVSLVAINVVYEHFVEVRVGFNQAGRV